MRLERRDGRGEGRGGAKRDNGEAGKIKRDADG